jgi:Rrf2 family protein
MKLTHAAYYALQALVYLARQQKKRAEQMVPSHEMAEAHQIPERFLLKVLRPLAAAQILLSVRGPAGGYRLARPARAITLLEVVEAVDGPMRGAAPRSPRAPDNGLHRKLSQVCGEIADQMRRQLARVKVSDLAAH